MDVPSDDRREVGRGYTGDNANLWRDGTEGAVFSFAADPGLVSFNDCASAAHWIGQVEPFFHGLPHPMAEKPGGFHAAAKGPLNLASADTFLAAGHEVEGLQPNMQRHVAVFEDGPHADSELGLAGITLIEALPGGLALEFAEPIGLAALGADRAIRPEVCFDISEGGFFVVEMQVGKGGLYGW